MVNLVPSSLLSLYMATMPLLIPHSLVIPLPLRSLRTVSFLHSPQDLPLRSASLILRRSLTQVTPSPSCWPLLSRTLPLCCSSLHSSHRHSSLPAGRCLVHSALLRSVRMLCCLCLYTSILLGSGSLQIRLSPFR